MADYDFSTLNSSDLEELVCDLLNLDQPENSLIKYKTFKDGKDKGIDILYSTKVNDYEHVGQVKHLYRTGYYMMFKQLKKDEVDKVKKLKPTKYIFATSVDLSVGNTEAIKTLFNPYIIDLNDIYGKKDINRLIEKYPVILDSHYKLWLSDFSILQKILTSDLEFRSSAFIETELKKRLSLYVKTSLFDNARKALEKNKFTIITGDPGVGKTTLAEMLVYEYVAKDYKLTYIIDDIKEAEKVLTKDDSKQIIYFDDFLGSNKVEINKAKGSETALLRILRRIESMENKLVVFTTRSYLLTTAIEESEKLRLFNIKARSSLFELKEYNSEIKKQLLDNHIELSDMNDDFKDLLRDDEVQKFIISHKSFSPRSVEFITSKDIVNQYSIEYFKEFIFTSFEKPDEIWKHAYTEQITEDDRLLLNTLLSFGETTRVDEIEEAFLARVQFEVDYNNKKKEMFAFQNAMRRLNGSFIFIKNENDVHFINPSLIDFLLNYIRTDKDEVFRIIESVIYATQLTERLFSLTGDAERKMPKSLQNRLLQNYYSFVSTYNGDYDLIQIAMVINKYVSDPAKEEVICEIIEDISDFESLHSNFSLNQYFILFMKSVKGSHKIYSLLQSRIGEIITDLFRGEDDLFNAITLLEELTKSFEINYLNIDILDIRHYLDELFENYIEQDIVWLKDYITHEGKVDEKVSELKELVDRLQAIGLYYKLNLDSYNEVDWFDVAYENEFRRLMEKDD